jgi:glycine cleavage system transcriptional repressor
MSTDKKNLVMEQYLVVSILGPNSVGILNVVSAHIKKNHCWIVRAHVTVLGNAFGMLLQINGKWNHITKLENSLDALAKKQDFAIRTLRCNPGAYNEKLITYSVDIITTQRPEIIPTLSQFFMKQKINISDLHCESFAARLTGTEMLSLTMKIHIPVNISLAELREEFINLCDELNLDAVMEPERGI